MERKVLRGLVVSGALVAGVGLVGASVASALVPDPGSYGGGSPTVNTGWHKSATVNGLRVRTGPGTESAVLGLVYRGEGVNVIGSARDSTGQVWDKVTLAQRSAGGLPEGYTGWITDMYLY